MDVNPQSLAATLADMEHACGDLGLHISWSKTKIQNVGAGSPAQTITVDGHQVAGIDKFTYLGCQLSSADRSRLDMRRRMGIASSTMQRRLCHTFVGSHTLPSLPNCVSACLWLSQSTSTRRRLGVSTSWGPCGKEHLLTDGWLDSTSAGRRTTWPKRVNISLYSSTQSSCGSRYSMVCYFLAFHWHLMCKACKT